MKFGVKHIVATAIGAAVFFLLARFASIPVFPNTYISFQYAVLGFFAAVFGPICGILIALIGHALTDLSFGWGIWWSWVIASGIVGLLGGFVQKSERIEEGLFGKTDILRFIIGNLIVHAISWCAIAPILDIIIYAEPADKVFLQGLIAGTSNFIITAIVGTLLLVGYSKTKVKTGSLD